MVAEPHAVEYTDDEADAERDALTEREAAATARDKEGDLVEEGEREILAEREEEREADRLAEALTILHCTYRMYVLAAPHAPPVGAVS